MDEETVNEALKDHPNRVMVEWLLDLAADLADPEAHSISAANVVIECGHCGGVHVRGFRDGHEADPDPLLAKIVMQRAVEHGRRIRRGMVN